MMKTTTTLSRFLLLIYLLGFLSACGSEEPKNQTKVESQTEVESHGHSHD